MCKNVRRCRQFVIPVIKDVYMLNLRLDKFTSILLAPVLSYLAKQKTKKRHRIFNQFLTSSKHTVNDVIRMGTRLMQEERLHPHFFGNNTLLENAQYLTFFALQIPYAGNHSAYLNKQLTSVEVKNILALFERRIAERIPVEYLTHEAKYLDNYFYVNDKVLIPRSVMSTRYDDFLAEIHWENHRILDLCTGSGCIGITLALKNPALQVDLVDISSDALEVADINIKKYALQDRVRCIKSDLFENVKNRYDLIISNPPYISTSEYQRAPAEFKNEPTIALESGVEGLDLIYRILPQAKKYLNKKGLLIVEVGVTAAKKIKKQYRQLPFKWLNYRKPNGQVGWLAMDCIFQCRANDLPNSTQASQQKNFNLFDFF
jgi:ribosomal protein L3 glutamine methyltransferase